MYDDEPDNLTIENPLLGFEADIDGLMTPETEQDLRMRISTLERAVRSSVDELNYAMRELEDCAAPEDVLDDLIETRDRLQEVL